MASAQELADAQAHLWNYTHSYVNSMSLKCAIQLAIPDVIHKHGKPITLSELADALPINKAKSDGLRRLMRILVHSKIFAISEVEEEAVYSLTPASRLLLKDEPLSYATFVDAFVDPVTIDPFYRMSEWFSDESPSPFVAKHGMDFWEYCREKDGKLNRRFNEAMACDARFVRGVLVKECRHVFDGLESLVDVAGGTGEVAKAIADAFPGVKCTVLDLPQVVGGLEGSENLRFLSGDMFHFIPPTDAVFLKWILHDWSDENCIRILKNCKEACKNSINGGKVIIVDMVVDAEKQGHVATETQMFFDMVLMVGVRLFNLMN